tara:strand:- start:67 stop:507 length:441 start_codon:yes stop_codon:yes gene_type:complete
MIVTSNSVTHNITIKELSKIGQVDSNLDVINTAVVSVASTIGFSQTFNNQTITGITTDGTPIMGVGTTTIDTLEQKETQETISFNTSNISEFVAFSSLTEDKVISWIPSNTLAGIQTANETVLLERKDKVLNPLKYDISPAELPWS